MRWPFYYGWVIVGVAFVTMAVGVNARTAFSLLFPPILDRIGREWVWTVGSAGFVVCYLALLLLAHAPTPALLYLMVLGQGALGYGLTAVVGAIPAEIFQGRHYGAIFGTVMLAAIAGGAAGPWVAGVLHDATGGYAAAFWSAIGCSGLSAIAIWLAAPRRVRAVTRRGSPVQPVTAASSAGPPPAGRA